MTAEWGTAGTVAHQVLAVTVKTEPDITATIIDVGEQVGVEPVDLEFRLKSPASLARKIATKARLQREPDLSKAAESVTDTVRYTYQADKLGQAVEQVAAGLAGRGWELQDVESSFGPDTPYKGLHTTWVGLEGQTVEVQFHTAASRRAKLDGHRYYQTVRDPSVALGERRRADRALRELWSQVPDPDLPAAVGDRPVVHKTYPQL